MKYRIAKIDDVEEISSLHEFEYQRLANKNRIEEYIKDYPSVACEKGDRIVGFILSTRFAPDILELANVVVSKDERNKKIGSKLLVTFENIALKAGWNSIILVNSTGYGGKDFPRATGFYYRHGYKIVHSTEKTNVFLKKIS